MHGEGIDSPPPGTRFPSAIKHALSLIKPSNQSTSCRRKGNSWANLTGKGREALLDTVFELRLLLDSSPVAISRIHNLPLLFICLDCCCRERSNLKKKVVEGGPAPSRLLPRVARAEWGQGLCRTGQRASKERGPWLPAVPSIGCRFSRGLSPPASALLAFCSPPCQLFNLSRRLMNGNEGLQTAHFNKAQVQSRGD